MKNIIQLLVITTLVLSCTKNSDREILSPRVNHVMLYVGDIDASIDLYTKAFDIEVTERVSLLKRSLSDGTTQEVNVKLALLKFPGQDFVYELAERSNLPDSIGYTATFQHIGIDVKDIETAKKRAIEAGFESMGDIRTVYANDIEAKNTFLKGPDGELVELMQMIAGEF